MAVSIMPSEIYIDEENETKNSSMFSVVGLRFHPFTEEGQILSFCDVPVTRKSYDRLIDLFDEVQKLPIIVGKKGAGKTTLMRKVSLARNRRFVMIQASAGLSVCNLLKRLALAADMPLPKLVKAPMEQTQEILEGLRERQITLTVMVDRAHLLPLETLAALVHCLAEQVDLEVRTMAIALFGERELIDRAKSLTLGGDDGIQIEVIRLQPLASEDIAHYCFSRLRQAGWRGMMPAISANISASILERTGGLPGKINEVISEHYFQFWLESWQSGKQRQGRMAESPQVQSRFVRWMSFLMLGGLVAWLTVAPVWAMQYGSWVQACHTVFHGYLSFSDYLVHQLAHLMA